MWGPSGLCPRSLPFKTPSQSGLSHTYGFSALYLFHLFPESQTCICTCPVRIPIWMSQRHLKIDWAKLPSPSKLLSQGTSLGVQWLRICLAAGGTWVPSLLEELDPTWQLGATKPSCLDERSPWRSEDLTCHNQDPMQPNKQTLGKTNNLLIQYSRVRNLGVTPYCFLLPHRFHHLVSLLNLWDS